MAKSCFFLKILNFLFIVVISIHVFLVVAHCLCSCSSFELIPSWNFWPFTLKNYGFTLQKYQFLFMFEIPTCLFGNCMLSLFMFIIWSDSRLEMWPLNKRNMISFVKVLIFFPLFQFVHVFFVALNCLCLYVHQLSWFQASIFFRFAISHYLQINVGLA